MAITMYVKDLLIIEREVTVPEKCPQCKNQLLDVPGALAEAEYQDQTRRLTAYASGRFDCCDDLPQSGESFIRIGLSCASCGHELGGGREMKVKGKVVDSFLAALRGE